MKKLTVVFLISLFLMSVKLTALGIPVFDLHRITALVAEHLPIKEWWDRYNREFEGGDGVRGLIKFDQLLLVNIWGSLEGLGPKRYRELFGEELKAFQQTFLECDYFERFVTDSIKSVLEQVVKKDFDEDVMGENVLQGNIYYAANTDIKQKVDNGLKFKREIYEKLAGMSKEWAVRSEVDQKDLERFGAVCDYIDDIDKGDDDPFGFLAFGKAVNQHELVMLMVALQNEEIQANRSILEMLRSLHELDIYRELEKLHEF